MQRQTPEKLAASGSATGDCLFVDVGDVAALAAYDFEDIVLPLVIGVPAGVSAPDLPFVDRADAIIFADDNAATMAGVFAAVCAPTTGLRVADFSDSTSRTINALSAEASRIADALARLAAEQNGGSDMLPVDSAMVRRLLRLRRDRERYFPAEILADPAWDMLLDLTAAQLEGKSVPVSSLCIAAAVPTTTALRWVRSLSEAGLFERRTDPGDARRSYVTLSPAAAEAMLAWLRMFAGAFATR